MLDEVQHAPHLFAALRPEIDADRRAGRFLLLGSVSGELLRQSGEIYRTAAGTEIDLVIEHRSRKTGIEIKFSAAPKPSKGFG